MRERQRLQPSRHVRTWITEHGAVLFDLRGRGHWYALNRAGSYWWQEITSGATSEDAVHAVAERFCADTGQVRTDMHTLTAKLTRLHLLRPVRRWPRW